MDLNTATASDTVNAHPDQPHVCTYEDGPVVNITVENVLTVTPLQLARWISSEILSIRLPLADVNSTLSITTDLVPLLPVISNRITLLTELFVIVVGATPPYTQVMSSGNKDMKALSEALGRKKDELYRSIQTMESMRETVSRMMTGLSAVDKLSGRFAGL